MKKVRLPGTRDEVAGDGEGRQDTALGKGKEAVGSPRDVHVMKPRTKTVDDALW